MRGITNFHTKKIGQKKLKKTAAEAEYMTEIRGAIKVKNRREQQKNLKSYRRKD